MESLAGFSVGVEPSSVLLKVLRITGHDDSPSVSTAF